MPDFTYDWQSNNFPLWDKILMQHKDRIKDILEIGCFEGRASVWFLEYFPNANLKAIDTFEGNADTAKDGIDFSKTQDRWFNNVRQFRKRVYCWVGESRNVLKRCFWDFDLILVDGDHTAPAVLDDLVLSWMLIKPKGIMIIDDYGWGNDRPEIQTPKPAVDSFLACRYDLAILHKGYQVIVQKI